MKVVDFLSPDAVVPALAGATKGEVADGTAVCAVSGVNLIGACGRFNTSEACARSITCMMDGASRALTVQAEDALAPDADAVPPAPSRAAISRSRAMPDPRRLRSGEFKMRRVPLEVWGVGLA